MDRIYTKPYKSNGPSFDVKISAVSFEKRDFNILARTGKALVAPDEYRFSLRNIPENYLQGCTVLETPYIDPDTGELCVVLGSCTGQAPFMPEGGKKKVKCGNVEFVTGDNVAYIDIVKAMVPGWDE